MNRSTVLLFLLSFCLASPLLLTAQKRTPTPAAKPVKPAAPVAKPAPKVVKTPVAKAPKVPIDSIFILFENGKKFIEHRVKAGESLFGMARNYGCTVVDIKLTNNLGEEGIKPGKVLKLPLANKAIVRYMASYKKDYPPLFYKVKTKETLFNVAKRYFKMPVDSIKKRNKLKSDVLSKNQVLQVGWLCKPCMSDTSHKSSIMGSKVAINYQELKTQYESNKENKTEKVEEGSAFWKKYDTVTDRSSLFCMYNGVPPGSVVEIVNPRTNRTIYAKVLGKIPQNDNTANTILVVSPAAAKALGAVDSRFWIKVKHY